MNYDQSQSWRYFYYYKLPAESLYSLNLILLCSLHSVDNNMCKSVWCASPCSPSSDNCFFACLFVCLMFPPSYHRVVSDNHFYSFSHRHHINFRQRYMLCNSITALCSCILCYMPGWGRQITLYEKAQILKRQQLLQRKDHHLWSHCLNAESCMRIFTLVSRTDGHFFAYGGACETA